MINYLEEIRARLIRVLICLLATFSVLFYFDKQLFVLLALPLLQQLGQNQTIVSIGITTPLIIPLKLSFYVAMFVTMPCVFYQIWAFVSPALYVHERRLFWRFVLSSSILFYLGALLAYFVVFPLVFHFFAAALPTGVRFFPDMAHYLGFALQLMLAFGLSFQFPLIIFFLVHVDFLSINALKKGRAYVIVLALTLGMLLTPPDVLSQILLAVPLYLLYELSIVSLCFLRRG